MKKSLKYIAPIALLAILLTNNAFAAGLVPCGGPGEPACNFCHLLLLGKNLIDLAIQLSFAFAGLFIAWGAFVIMTGGGSSSRVSEGKKIMETAIIGIVIVLGAWMIIGTTLQILTGSSSKLPWTEISCESK